MVPAITTLVLAMIETLAVPQVLVCQLPLQLKAASLTFTLIRRVPLKAGTLSIRIDVQAMTMSQAR
jgi:hypothetical protein